jgi:hypothetical protein
VPLLILLYIFFPLSSDPVTVTTLQIFLSFIHSFLSAAGSWLSYTYKCFTPPQGSQHFRTHCPKYRISRALKTPRKSGVPNRILRDTLTTGTGPEKPRRESLLIMRVWSTLFRHPRLQPTTLSQAVTLVASNNTLKCSDVSTSSVLIFRVKMRTELVLDTAERPRIFYWM